MTPDSAVVCRTGSNGQELEHSNFHTNMQKNFLTVRLTKPWNKLLREVVKALSLEIFKTHLDTFLCDPL